MSLPASAADGRTTVPDAITLSGAVRRYSASAQVGPLDVRVPHHSCLGLIGSNGAGKSTMLRMICGLEPCDEGEIRVSGTRVEPGRMPSGLSALIEEPRFFPWLTGLENLAVATAGHPRLRDPDQLRADTAPQDTPTKPAGNDIVDTSTAAAGKTDASAVMFAMLEHVGLADAARTRVREYSQGMRQRLGIARTLLRDSAVVMLDEPTNGLDPTGMLWFRGLISRLRETGTTVVLSSHMLHEVQLMCDQYVMLDAGEVAAAGQTQDLRETTLEDEYQRLRRPRP